MSYVTAPEGFPARLLHARTAAGLTQRGLAFPGCTAVFISRMETGQRLPSGQLIEGLAERLKVSEHWLRTGKEDPLVLVARQIVDEFYGGVQVPGDLIEKLDRLTRPRWYSDYATWLDEGAVKTFFPPTVPRPVPGWAKRLYRREHQAQEGRESWDESCEGSFTLSTDSEEQG